MDKRITLLLGAGASAPFIAKGNEFLTTGYLTESLCNPEMWESILTDFKRYKIESKNMAVWALEKEDVFFVIDRIIKRLEVKNDVNFESVLYFLDHIAPNLHSKYDWPSSMLADFWSENDSVQSLAFQKGSDRQGWKYVPFLAREVLIRALLNLWDLGRVETKAFVAQNIEFYKKINEDFKRLSIYSLNYDPLITEVAKGVGGITMAFSGNNVGFQNDVLLKDANKVLCFLHGHAGFVPIGGQQVFFNDKYQKAQEIRLRGVFRNDTQATRFFDFGMRGLHYNTYIVSGLDKIDAFYSNPFSCYMHRFSRDMLEADYIVVIGTSLNDEHLNLFFKNSLAYSNKKIIFVGKRTIPQGWRILEDLEFQKEMSKMWYISGDKLSLPLDSVERTLPKHFENINRNLVDNGYGQITSNVFMYTKGVEEFYKVGDIEALLEEIKEKQAKGK